MTIMPKPFARQLNASANIPALGAGRQRVSGDEPALPVERAIAEALEMLYEKDTRAQATRALTRLGDPAAVALLDLVHDDDSAIREAATWVVARIKARRWTRDLIKASAWTYRHVADPIQTETFTTLRHAVRVGSLPSQVMAALALGQLKEQRAMPELADLLGSQHALGRMAAIRALVWIGDQTQAERIQDALDDPDGAVRLCASKALANVDWQGGGWDDKLAGQADSESASVAAGSAKISHD